MSSSTTIEYLGVDAPPRRRWPWLVGAILLVVAAVAGAALAWADGTARSTNTRLVEVLGAADTQASSGETRVRVALAYIAPAVWRWDLPETKRDELWKVVSDEAEAAAVGLASLRSELDDLTVLPWRSEQEAARAALVGLLDDQEERFRTMAADVRRVDLFLAGGPIPIEPTAQAMRAAGVPVR